MRLLPPVCLVAFAATMTGMATGGPEIASAAGNRGAQQRSGGPQAARGARVAPTARATPIPVAPATMPAAAPAAATAAPAAATAAPAAVPSAAPPAVAFGGATPAADATLEPRDVVARRVALTVSPFALLIGRYGGSVEILVAPHHAVVASGYVQTFPTAMLRILLPSAELGEGPAARPGAELGYRFYTTSDSASGVFVGPSLLAMPIAYPRVTESLRAEVVSFHALGAALDLGAQIVTGGGFVFGGGVGVMALAYTPPASIAAPAGVAVPSYPEPHVLPRLLLSAGWAF